MIEGVPEIAQEIPEKKPEEIEREKFDRQYDNPEKVSTEGGDFFVHEAIPEVVSDPVPVVFCPGWVEDPVNGKETLRVLYNQGRRVLWIDAPHGIKTGAIEGIAQEELQKAQATLAALDAKGIERCDAIAHSEGGINTSIAGVLAPEKFRGIVFVESGGMIGWDNLISLAVRSYLDMRAMFKSQKTIPPEYAFKDDPVRGKMYFIDTWMQTLKETFAISQSDIHDNLKFLKEHGVGVSMIHGVDDKFFPMKKVQDTTTSEHVHGFYSVQGDHQKIITEPTKWGKAANAALQALANRPEEKAREEAERMKQNVESQVVEQA